MTRVTAQQFGGEKARAWPRFFEIAHNLHAALVDFNTMDSKDMPEQRVIADNVYLHEANGIGSRITNLASSDEDFHRQNMHKPVLDLDVPHFYTESTTLGHGHLIVDVEVPWADYVELLTIMEKCKILEPGYVAAALNRQESWMRTPWITKGGKGNDNK